MQKKIKISDLPEFDVAEYLEDEKAIAEYLTIVMEENDPALLAAALGDIARARGMTEVARKAGIAREALYKALRADAQPRFDTVQRVVTALGVKLTAVPLCPEGIAEHPAGGPALRLPPRALGAPRVGRMKKISHV